MRRHFSDNRKSRHSNSRTNLIAVITLVAILTGILLYFTNEWQNEQVFQSYCGDFGFYGKSLVLMKDSTFRFSYHGCSQAKGFIAGNWSLNGPIMSFSPEQPDEHLDSQYLLRNFQLIPINEPVSYKFTLCEQYQDPLKRIVGNKTYVCKHTMETGASSIFGSILCRRPLARSILPAATNFTALEHSSATEIRPIYLAPITFLK